MSKKTIPSDVKMQVTGIVRGYERCRKEYMSRRRDILDAGSVGYTSVTGGREHRVRRSAEDKQMQLDALDKYYAFRQVRAVDHALTTVCQGYPEEMARALRSALLLNCQSGRKYPYERLYVIGMGRTSFYRAREAFFLEIAQRLDFLV